MPESFVNQCMARCSVSGSKIWFSCNPEGNTHFIKAKFIDRFQDKNLVIVHFILDDNLTLSDERKDFYKRQWRGVFYRRFILGEWCLADGLVYSSFDRDSMVFDGPINWDDYDLINIGADYGIQNPTAFVMVGYNHKRKRMEVIKDWSYSGREMQEQKTDDELYTELDKFIGATAVNAVYIDPSATSFHAIVRKRGKYRNREADNSVNAGIGFVAMLFSLGQLYIHESCSTLLSELSAYSWDSEASEKQGNDIVLKQSDHACDALRYVLYSYYHPRAKSYKLGEYADLI
jgi:PBSX family phage terminase large subunit